MPDLPVVLSVKDAALSSGLRGMESKVASSSKRAAAAMEKSMTASASRVNKSMSNVGNAMGSSVAKGMDRLKNSAAIGAVGGFASVGLRNMTDQAIAAGDAAATAGNKLDSVLSASGQSGAAKKLDAMADVMSRKTGFDDDDIAEASARMINLGASAENTAEIFPKLAAKARLSGKDMNTAATLAGKAFQGGNVAGLKKIGIDIDAMGEKSIKAAYKISQAAGQLELMNQLQKSLANVDIGAGIDANVAAKGYYATQSGNLQESMGKGASAMRARWQGAAAPVLGAAANSPVAGALGGMMEIGTQLMPLATGITMLGQAMPALEKGSGLFSGIVSKAGKLGEFGPAAVNAFSGATAGLRASGAAAIFSGNAHAAAAIKTRAAGVAAMGVVPALGAAGAALAALAVTAYGINETIHGIKNAQTLSDEELQAKGPLGSFHASAGHALGSGRFGAFMEGGFSGLSHYNAGENAEKESMALHAKLRQKAIARRSREGYQANIKVTIPESHADRAMRAY